MGKAKPQTHARGQRNLSNLLVGLLFVTLVSGCNDAPSPTPAPAAQIDLAVLKERAERGEVRAQQELGDAYATGRAVVPNYKEAAKWLTKAAEQGDARAQYGLAQLFEAGQGVKQSYEDASTWYRKAADQGHAEAQYGLAVLYAFGRGKPMSDVEAAKWYLKAAENAEPLAQFNIGQRFQAGRGVSTDLVEAYKWLSLAAKELPDAAGARDELKRQLSRQQLGEPKRRIEQFAATNHVGQPKQ
jgi:TPR repeat protein